MISGGSPKIRMQKTARVGGRNVLGHGRWKHGGEGMFLGHGRWNHDIPFWTRTNRQAPILLMEENLHQFTKKSSHYFYSKSQYSPRCRISSINNMTLQTHRNTFWVPFWPLASHQSRVKVLTRRVIKGTSSLKKPPSVFTACSTSMLSQAWHWCWSLPIPQAIRAVSQYFACV